MSLFTDPGVAYQTRIFHLQDLARHLQWQYTPTVPWQSLPYAESFQLFRRGDCWPASNVIHGLVGNVQVIVFEHRYQVGNSAGHGGVMREETVAMFQSIDLNLPMFQLKPKTFKHRLGSVFSGSMDFSNCPKFTEQYLVSGTDENGIRRAFNPQLIVALEANPGWTIEGGGGQFFFYREDQMVMPEQMQWLIETGKRVLELMEAPEASATTA